ncbi:MAG: DUF86 domain-containing protein [Bacillota bacterium]
MISKNKVLNKIHFIKQQLNMLNKIKDTPEEVFDNNDILIAASIRYLQISVEAMIDLANHVCSRNHWGIPKTYGEAFTILHKKGVILEEDLKTYLKMVKFRNRAVHIYDEMNPREVYLILQNNLKDFERYIASITGLLE